MIFGGKKWYHSACDGVEILGLYYSSVCYNLLGLSDQNILVDVHVRVRDDVTLGIITTLKYK